MSLTITSCRHSDNVVEQPQHKDYARLASILECIHYSELVSVNGVLVHRKTYVGTCSSWTGADTLSRVVRAPTNLLLGVIQQDTMLYPSVISLSHYWISQCRSVTICSTTLKVYDELIPHVVNLDSYRLYVCNIHTTNQWWFEHGSSLSSDVIMITNAYDLNMYTLYHICTRIKFGTTLILLGQLSSTRTSDIFDALIDSLVIPYTEFNSPKRKRVRPTESYTLFREILYKQSRFKKWWIQTCVSRYIIHILGEDIYLHISEFLW